MTATEHAEQHTDHASTEHAHKHPSDFQYVMIALFLAVVTGAEVALYYIKSLDFLVLAGLLTVLMIVKFVTVVGFFMHLRFDSKVFRWIFTTGLLLATFVYLVALSTFHVFKH